MLFIAILKNALQIQRFISILTGSLRLLDFWTLCVYSMCVCV